MGYNIRRNNPLPVIAVLLLFLSLTGCGSTKANDTGGTDSFHTANSGSGFSSADREVAGAGGSGFTERESSEDSGSSSADLETSDSSTITEPESLDLADGTYTAKVTLEGGSGRSSVVSPAVLKVQEGSVTAEIIWTSPHYDFMEVEGKRFLPVNNGGNSTFVIPVTGFDCKMPVRADTTAMSTPHLIDYTLEFDSSSIAASDADTGRKNGMATHDDAFPKAKSTPENSDKKSKTAANAAVVPNSQSKTENVDGRGDTATSKKPDWEQMKPTGHMPLSYAAQFSVDYYGSYTFITVGGDSRYLLIPHGKEIPLNLDSDIIPIGSSEKIYLAASAAMDYFRELGKLDRVRMTSTKAADWSLPEIVRALDAGDILYAGKYSAPDYELILGEGCDLAIESTMIYHTPETKEKLETLGIPVFVDKSSYEEHPLGRMEWIRLYGVLLGISDKADAFFSEQLESLKTLPVPEDNPSVAYFYITTSGSANIRKPGDYISRMIELSGGRYAFSDEADAGSAQATMNIQMETFYAEAMETDILIYSTSIDGDVESLKDLFSKAPLLESSKAARSGNIWVSGKNVYQQPTAIARIMLELHSVISGQADGEDMEFLHRLT